MKLDVKGLAIVFAILWGGCVLVVGGAATLLGPSEGSYYGKEFLLMLASVYPGYTGTPGLANTVIGTLYAALDGLIGGALIAWLYNRVARGS